MIELSKQVPDVFVIKGTVVDEERWRMAPKKLVQIFDISDTMYAPDDEVFKVITGSDDLSGYGFYLAYNPGPPEYTQVRVHQLLPHLSIIN
jgi:hypothetical protein